MEAPHRKPLGKAKGGLSGNSERYKELRELLNRNNNKSKSRSNPNAEGRNQESQVIKSSVSVRLGVFWGTERERTKGCACCTADAEARVIEALQEVGLRGTGLGSEVGERSDCGEADFFDRIVESASECWNSGRSASLEDSSGQGTSRGCFFHESLFEGEARFGAEIKQRAFGEFSDVFIRGA